MDAAAVVFQATFDQELMKSEKVRPDEALVELALSAAERAKPRAHYALLPPLTQAVGYDRR